MTAIAERPTFDSESWQIVVTSDHGGYHGDHGGGEATQHTIPFLVVSRDVAQGRLPQTTRNMDVVPTVLYFLGLPVARDMDGEPRTDVFAGDFNAQRTITLIPTYEH